MLAESSGRASRRRRNGLCLWAALGALAVLVVGTPSPAEAYVGPGAGIAFVSSFLVLFTTILLSFLSLLVWPFRMAIRAFKWRHMPKPKIRRFIVVGLDGQDPQLTDRFMAEGKLPNFQRLAEQGCYHRLATTFPSVSPVAWSSFSTGSHPARHNIYDFLDRDRRTYLPVLSSTRIGTVERRLKLGKFRFPIGKPELRLLRMSKPFWKILGEHNIWSTVLRVPITFPPEQFRGAQLSAMCVPDVLGTQGTFIYFTTRPGGDAIKEGGIRVHLSRNGAASSGDRFDTALEGPANDMIDGNPPMKLPMTIDIDRQAGHARVDLGGATHTLEPGKLTDWVDIAFKAAPGVKIRGICRMMVTEMDEHFGLYVTPISFDPEKPAMPVSHPSYYSTYLAKKIGKYSTLGLAEDTWALNEGIIDDGTFLQMTYDIDKEREDMFFASLDKLRKGSLVCVFDATDRIQHMFWRYLEEGHPAARAAREANGGADPEHADAIEQLYIHNDGLVGRVMERMRDGDMLMVCSDHGFNSFRRGVNLNTWLHANGYLALEDGADGTDEWLRGVDWSKTKAYALGLTGIFLNIAGREQHGIVEPGTETQALKDELIEKLSGLLDDEAGEVGVRELFDTARLYDGPYLENAPDLLVGYNAGYRCSWDMATGVVAGAVFEDNVKAWSGDHCIDPRIVPGVLFCNRPIDVDDPALIDIAPTALQQFGIKPPKFMDGKVLFDDADTVREQPSKAPRAAAAMALSLALLAPALGCGSGAPPAHEQSMIVLGIDGMDYALTRRLLDEGRLPNLQRLADAGGFQALGTSIPPQSPVAWSDFITGLDSGGHGIYDFLHREPEIDFKTPYLSTSRALDPGRTITFGRWSIPLSGGGMESLRRGVPFWEVLEANGVPTTIMRMPANFPPSGSASRELSGMGTPDILGTPGVYSFYATDTERITANTESLIQRVVVEDGVVESELVGPAHPLLVEPEDLKAPFTVYIDADQPVAKLVVGSTEVILQPGEWTDWVEVQFELIPYLQSVPATARFFLKQIRPEFELYVSPINLDPMAPVMPITTPAGYAAELAAATGRFYTQGMPEDTNALNDGVFNNADFMAQAEIAGAEIRRQYDYVLDNFAGGFLFYYFGNLDQVSHMMWRTMETDHPAYDPRADPPYRNAVIDRYLEVDELVGATLDRMAPGTTLVVMSDHGFTAWRRAMNLNTWLLENDYITLTNPRRRVGIQLFGNVNWSRTRAYGVGLNGLYINLRGREGTGIVAPEQRDALIAEISNRLLEYVDPATGEPAVTKVYARDEVFDDRGQLAIGPDIIVGFASGTRLANESALGEFSDDVIVDNTDPWSGDHLMDHEAVPGVLFTNRNLGKSVTALKDLAGALLAEFGIDNFPPAHDQEE